jgi:hypothetical protein
MKNSLTPSSSHAQVNLLLTYQADPRVANHFNYTALDYCVWSGYEIEGVEILGNCFLCLLHIINIYYMFVTYHSHVLYVINTKNPIHKTTVQKKFQAAPSLSQPDAPIPNGERQSIHSWLLTVRSACRGLGTDYELGVGSGLPTPEYLLYEVTNLLYKGAHHGMGKNWKRAQSANARIFTT